MWCLINRTTAGCPVARKPAVALMLSYLPARCGLLGRGFLGRGFLGRGFLGRSLAVQCILECASHGKVHALGGWDLDGFPSLRIPAHPG